MSEPSRPIGEEDLHGFVDGRLPPARREAVERYLAEHPDAAARVAGWQDGSAALRRALAPLAAEPVPASLSLSHLARRRSVRRWGSVPVAAAIMLALAGGAGAGWVARGPGQSDGVTALAAEASAAHGAFAGAHGAPLQFTAAKIDELSGWASRRLGRGINAPDLSAAGFHLLGGGVVATDRGAGCLYLYAGNDGARISVFMRPMRPGTDDEHMRAVEARGAGGFAWAHDGLGVTVISNDATAGLQDLSNRVRDALSG